MEKDVTEPPCCFTKTTKLLQFTNATNIYVVLQRRNILQKKKDATYLIEKRMIVKTSLEFF